MMNLRNYIHNQLTKTINHSYIVLYCLLIFSMSTFSQSPRNLLQNIASKFSDSQLLNKDFKPYASYHDREFWNSLPSEIKEKCIIAAEKSTEYVFGTVSMTSFLDYKRTGSRTESEKYYNDRNDNLRNLVLGELVEGKGRFMDAILNGTWSICEQTYWGVSAHLAAQKAGIGVPDVNEPTIDLVSGEMANLLAWTYYFFHEEFDKTSLLINRRIKQEIDRKIIQPYLLRNDFWWQATKPGVIVNNWNPWCNFNVLSATLLTSDDYNLKVRLLRKTMTSVDQFINYYKNDGGCEEGPTYWDHAAGKMLEYLELVKKFSGGRVDIFDNVLIKRMGKYIALAYIGDSYYLNFADAMAVNKGLPDIVYRYGKAINDKCLMNFGAYLVQNISPMPEVGGTLDMSLQKYLIWNEMKNSKAELSLPDYFWLEGLEVAGARIKEGSTKGFFFGAKGGNNDESHNHNDVGSFILYYNADPILIDAGVGTYTSKTFSSKRYELWNMQSAYHNLPMINGFQQLNGKKYKATQVEFCNTKLNSNFSLDIAKAYPEVAKCKSWMRCYYFDRVRGLTIKDHFELDSLVSYNKINLLVAGNVKELSSGLLLLSGKKEKLVLHYNPSQFNYHIDEIQLDDIRLSNVWGKSIYRLSFIAKEKILKSEYQMSISLEKY